MSINLPCKIISRAFSRLFQLVDCGYNVFFNIMRIAQTYSPGTRMYLYISGMYPYVSLYFLSECMLVICISMYPYVLCVVRMFIVVLVWCFRPRLHWSWQIIALTNFSPGPPVLMDRCKFCYILQWCLHCSLQILRTVIFGLFFYFC